MPGACRWRHGLCPAWGPDLPCGHGAARVEVGFGGPTRPAREQLEASASESRLTGEAERLKTTARTIGCAGRLLGLAAILAGAGCDDATLSSTSNAREAPPVLDSGGPDSGVQDSGGPGRDGEALDRGARRDQGAHDGAATADASPLDLGTDPGRDGAFEDGSLDVGPQDARPLDAGAQDGAPEDAGPPDAGPPDTGPPDGGPEDAALRCEPLPVICGAAPAVAEHRMAELAACRFALVPEGDLAANRARADALCQRMGGRLDLVAVLDDLNRDGQPGITAGAADRLRNHDYVGLRFNAGDQATPDWYPQGLSGADDAWPGGHPRRLLLVSWYDHDDLPPVKGVRLTLIDATDPDAARYRHLLLVEPRGEGANLTFDPITLQGMGDGGPLHAGGIVWAHPWLYVADTQQGFRVFDLSRVARVPDVDAEDRVGIAGGRIDAFSYRFVVPQVLRYRPAPGACPVRFSFAGLDRSAEPPLLVSGEYHADDVNGRLVSWPLDADTGRLLTEPDGTVRGVAAVVSGQTRVQGGVSWEGDYYLSSSSQVNGLGRLYRTRPGLESRITAWPRGCEDLYVERSTDLIWTVTEHPNEREVVGIPRQAP